MIKKKAKKKAAAAKKAAKRISPKKGKQLHPAEVRKDIALMVESEAKKMAKAVIDAGKTGQLATVKYLFEVAEIFPASTDGSQATSEEDSLAKTLLNRLNLPDEPIVRDENGEVLKVKAVPAVVEEAGAGEDASDTAEAEEQKDPVLM